MFTVVNFKTFVAAVGFEPTPLKRLVPKTNALDRSAPLPRFYLLLCNIFQLDNGCEIHVNRNALLRQFSGVIIFTLP